MCRPRRLVLSVRFCPPLVRLQENGTLIRTTSQSKKGERWIARIYCYEPAAADDPPIRMKPVAFCICTANHLSDAFRIAAINNQVVFALSPRTIRRVEPALVFLTTPITN